MKKLITLFIIILGLIATKSCAWNPDKWTTQDTILQSTFIALTIIDLCHTYTFLYEDPYRGNFKEANPFMGEHPSKTKFFILGVTGILVHTGISHGLHYLPTKINKFLIPAWQMLYIGVELKAINHNYIAGIRINF